MAYVHKATTVIKLRRKVEREIAVLRRDYGVLMPDTKPRLQGRLSLSAPARFHKAMASAHDAAHLAASSASISASCCRLAERKLPANTVGDLIALAS